jgi:lipopolysaccharide biosynthesis protein
MKSELCIFVSYTSGTVYSYVRYFVDELSCHFDEVIFVTNKQIPQDDEIRTNSKVTVLHMKNEGYDFGMFYKVLGKINILNYSRIALVNDSNILFKKLDDVFAWGKSSCADMWGLTDSFQGLADTEVGKSYHIQSHFLVFESNALPFLHAFFNEIHFAEIFKTDLSITDLRWKIIAECEIGITQYMLSRGLNVNSFFSSDEFVKIHYNGTASAVNMHITLWKQLIQCGYPLIKKKIVLNSHELQDLPPELMPDFSDWPQIVKGGMDTGFDFNKVFADLQ